MKYTLSDLFIQKEKASALECTAVIKAVDTCIQNGILSDLLRKNKAEVMNMILTEFDEEDYREFLREEARERGLAEGLAEGIQAFISVCQDFHLAYEDTSKKLLPIWNNIGNKMKMSSN